MSEAKSNLDSYSFVPNHLPKTHKKGRRGPSIFVVGRPKGLFVIRVIENDAKLQAVCGTYLNLGLAEAKKRQTKKHETRSDFGVDYTTRPDFGMVDCVFFYLSTHKEVRRGKINKQYE